MKTKQVTLQELWNNGIRDRKTLIKVTGYPSATIERTLKKLREGRSLERKKGSGRPAILKSKDRRRLVQMAKKNDMMTSSELRTKMIERGSPAVHSSTIRRSLNRSGYFSLKPVAAPLLTDHHKLNRLTWCQEHRNTRWNRWVFSDESRFELYRHKEGHWSKKRPQIGVPKFGPSIMIWGAISARGKSQLVIVRGSINSMKYQEILTTAEGSIKQLYPRGFMFQQDGATCHTSKSTRDWFTEHNWRVSDWPANSPDLNPIENVWGIMKKIVEKEKSQNIQDLGLKIQNVWDNLSIE